MEVEGNDLVLIFIFFVSFFFLLFLFFGVKCVCVLRIFFFPLQLVVATIQNLQVKRKTEIKHLRIVNRLITSFVRSFVTRIVLFLSLSLSRARVLKCKKKRKKKRGGGREQTLGNLQNRFTPFVKPDKTGWNWFLFFFYHRTSKHRLCSYIISFARPITTSFKGPFGSSVGRLTSVRQVRFRAEAVLRRQT